jgi:hypothetical protein
MRRSATRLALPFCGKVTGTSHMPNRQQRRAEKARREKSRSRKIQIELRDVDSKFDIQVEAKMERVVMILANAKGRRVVEDLWPDVEWSR